MSNVTKEVKTHDLTVEKIISKPVSEVFRALAEGRLFTNCSASDETIQIDFREGGKYRVEFRSYGMINTGEFLEIIPNQKIVFTWCQDFDSHPVPDTTVTVLLKDFGHQTALTLTHAGFSDAQNCKEHMGGWTSGLGDLEQEMLGIRVQMTRKYSVPLVKLYESCKNPYAFFAPLSSQSKIEGDFQVGGKYRFFEKKGIVTGEYLEIHPNQKIIFSWNVDGESHSVKNSKVTLLLEAEDESSSWITLIHEGLMAESQQKVHRMNWDILLDRFLK